MNLHVRIYSFCRVIEFSRRFLCCFHRNWSRAISWWSVRSSFLYLATWCMNGQNYLRFFWSNIYILRLWILYGLLDSYISGCDTLNLIFSLYFIKNVIWILTNSWPKLRAKAERLNVTCIHICMNCIIFLDVLRRLFGISVLLENFALWS